jgi:hypothetical protein
MKRVAEKNARILFHSLLEFFSKELPHQIVIPNGRFPYQKALVLAARRFGIAVTYYERGFRPESGVYIGEHMTVDRVAWQRLAKQHNESFDDMTRKASRQWLLSRQKQGSMENEFSTNWKSNSKESELFQSQSPKYSAAFFTSSQDEFLALEDWQGFGWSDQYEAFVEFAQKIQGPFVLRIHPNFVNKTFGHAFEEIRRVFWMIKNLPDLKVIWPTSPINSYEVIQKAERIFVHGSTIGLEASATGKPVWNSGSSMYDINGDVRNFLPQTEYPESFFQKWNVDTRRAEAIVDAQILADIPIPGNLRQNRRWNAQSIPLLIRIFNLLYTNLGFYFIVLLKRSASIRLNKVLVGISSLVYHLVRKKKVTF